MRDYVREHTFGGFIRSVFGIYFGNFPVFFVIYLIPLVPLGWLASHASLVGEVELSAVASLLNLLVAIFVSAAMTVAVSDVCLGNRPGVLRSYRRLTRVIGPLLGTYLLMVLIIIVGMVLLVVPGVAASIYLMFSLTVVVLERIGGVKALKRSYHLVKDRFWRNLGVIFVMGLLIGLSHALIVLVLVFVGAEEGNAAVMALLIFIVSNVLGPLALIAVVLLYYDCRVRKEHFDSGGLAQELMQ